MVGHPVVEGAQVDVDLVSLLSSSSSVQVLAEVEEITKDRKVIIFKMRRRKNSKRKRGFRRSVVILRVKDIIVGNNVDEFKDKL